MSNDTITFTCPACGIRLTVPGNLAGVSGPCPSCRAAIQAPHSQSLIDSPIPSLPEEPQVESETDDAKSDLPTSVLTNEPLPVLETQNPPATLRPEPRQLPNRLHVEPIAKQMPEPIHPAGSSKASPPPRHPAERNRLLRFSMAILFIVAAVTLVYGVHRILNEEPNSSTPAHLPAPAHSILPDSERPPKHPEPNISKPEQEPTEPSISIPLPVPPTPSMLDPSVELPAGIEPLIPGKAENDLLEKFLAAKSLKERLPMIETKTSLEELAKSCLAKPLPAVTSVLRDSQENNVVEQVTDIYFSVDFDAGNNQSNPQIMLVRTRGREDPKVVVDPFLDSFGGRLAEYASKPHEKSGVFQVIIWALASCNDENVPNREKKLTLKLLPRDNCKEIARAYFGRQSKIGTMLEDGTYSLSYGKAKACTVVLRWNTEDDPKHPYLEAINLKTLDWNP